MAAWEVLKMWKRILFLSVSSLLLINLNTEASSIRNNFMDNINSGLKMLGKNDRRLFFSHHSYYDSRSGISNKVADLVSQSFAPSQINAKRNHNRQDAIVIGSESSSVPDNSLMNGMLKLLGFDSSKIGAAAVNGIIFIAQMVRYGATKFMDYMMTKTWDWYKIVDYISTRVRNETDPTPTVVTPDMTIEEIRF